MPILPSAPTLVQRLVKGSPLTFAEGDANENALSAYCLALAQFITGSFNPDGTLIAGSVNSQALQAASVTLASLNPALLYSIVPVDTDIGATPPVQNSYAIVARGGLPGANTVPALAVYDANGNYVLTGLTLNYGYYWTKGANDASCASTPPLTSSGAFTANTTSVLLTGTPNATIQATVVRSAPISAYVNGQMFFVYTTNVNSGPSTLNVNNLGAIPIKLNGQQLTSGQIAAQSVFAVVYEGGVFVMVSAAATSTGSGGANGGTTVITTTGVSGTTVFQMAQAALPTSAFPVASQVFHGLGSTPSTFIPALICIANDSGFTLGQTVPLGQFTLTGGTAPAFDWSYDSQNLYFTQFGAPYIVNPSTGSSVAITSASWQLTASASAITSYAGVSVFPSLNYEAIAPQGAFTYGQALFVFSLSQYNSGANYLNKYNLLNNEVTPLQQLSSATGLTNVNGAVFGTTFNFTLPTYVFLCAHGIYTLPAINPGSNAIPPATSYNSSGTAVVTISASTTYVWSPGPNDSQLVVGASTYLASSAINGQITFASGASTTGTLTGTPSTVIQGTIITTSSAWAISASFSTQLTGGLYKPVWITTSAPNVLSAVYAVSSGYNSDPITNIGCYKVTTGAAQKNGAWASTNTNALNLTNTNIVNVSGFTLWHQSGTGAKPLLFQYNPITKRIYVITSETSLVHIFQLNVSSNDFSAWWNTASPTREQGLTFIKTLALAGMGRQFSNINNCNYTVEFDPNSGKEVCIVMVRDGNGSSQPGSITRIPWVE